MEVSAFMTKQLKEYLTEQWDHDEKLRQEAKAERLELEAKLGQQQADANAETEKQRLEMQATVDQLREEAVEARVRNQVRQLAAQEHQLPALQSRGC